MRSADPAAGQALRRLSAILWALLSLSALTALAVFVWVVVHRIGYPFELEWIEGGMVDHTDRVRTGLAIYAAPTVDHVAYLYTPLLYYLAALLSIVTGPGFLPLRLVSLLATLVCAFLVFRLVRTEASPPTGTLAGVVGAGIFLAGYGLVDSWFDLARTDALFLALLSACVVLLRTGDTPRLVAAGAVFCLAFLAKQTALMLLPPLLVAAAALGLRRLLWFGLSAGGLLGLTVLTFHLATDGWFTWFVFGVPSGHALRAQYVLGFWTVDMLPLLPSVVLGLGYLIALWRSGRVRRCLFDGAVAGGLLLASYASRLHAGGHINVIMYALLGGAVLSGSALATASAGHWRVAAQGLCLLQFAVLIYDPIPLLPRAEHRQASERFVNFLRDIDGDVFVPFHGRLTVMAGKPAHAHMQAMVDALSSGNSEVTARLARDVGEAFAERRFAAIVLDQPDAQMLRDYFRESLAGYRLRAEWGDQLEVMRPAVGMDTRPALVLEPVRQGRSDAPRTPRG